MRLRVFLKFLCAYLLILPALACDSRTTDSSAPTSLVEGLFGASQALWVEEDFEEYRYWIDTGSPRTQLEPRTIGFPIDSFQEIEIQREALGLGGFNDGETPVVVVQSAYGLDELSPNFGGLIGMDLLAYRTWTHDPRTRQLLFGDPASVTDDAIASRKVNVDLVGPGQLCFGIENCAQYAEHRAIARVQIDGVEVLALVDTGADHSILTAEVAARLPHTFERAIRELDGRTSRRIRVPQMGLKGVTAFDVALDIREFDAALARLQIETGLRVEAFLGMDFLGRFATTFDFPNKQIQFHAFSDFQYYPKEDDRGLTFMVAEESDACFRVTRLVVGGDAESQGLKLGDCVVDINGVAPGEGQLNAFRQKLQNLSLGDTITLDVMDESTNNARTLTLVVQVLLDHLAEPGVLIE